MMSFDGVVCRCMYSNSKHVVYNWCKAGMLYIRGM